MDRDTKIGGARDRFPETRRSAIHRLGDEDAAIRRQSYETVVAAYWKPAYKYVRLRWNESNDAAKDLIQGFFAAAIERDTLTGYNPAKGAFRTYLRTCLDGFVLNRRTHANRLKRAGDLRPLSLDFEGAEGELRAYEIPSSESLEDFFHREWTRSLFALALEDVRQQCELRGKPIQFKIFENYDLNDGRVRPSYAELARQFGVSETAVTNYLAAIRRDLRKAVLAKLRELTATEREFRAEARAMLGIEI